MKCLWTWTDQTDYDYFLKVGKSALRHCHSVSVRYNCQKNIHVTNVGRVLRVIHLF